MAQAEMELSEQTPLKYENDTQNISASVTGTETNTVGAETTTAEQNVQEKKRWFFNKKQQAKDVEKNPEVFIEKENGAEEGAPTNAKKSHWWQFKCQGNKPNVTPQQMSYGLNFAQRDDRDIQSCVAFDFADIYGEPDNVHSIDGVWKTNYIVFEATKNFFYKFFSLLISIPFAILFGIFFALFSAFSVFVCVPGARLLSIPSAWIFKIWSFVVYNVFNPIFQSIGQVFGQVKISSYGINTDPTAVLTA